MSGGAKARAPAQLLGMRLSHLEPRVAVAVCVAAAVVFHVFFSLFKEMMYHVPGYQWGLYTTLLECALVVLVATAERRAAAQPSRWRRVPLRYHALHGVLMLGGPALSNVAGARLSYHIGVVVKQLKLVVVMALQRVWWRHRFQGKEVLGACIVVWGAGMFMWTDRDMSPTFDATALLLCVVSVVCHAGMMVVQERVFFHRYALSSSEIMLATHGAIVPVLLALCVTTGELAPSLAWFSEHSSVYTAVVMQAATGYVATAAVLSIIDLTDAATAVMVTTTRQVVSVAASFLFYLKPFHVRYAYSAMVLWFGVVLHATHRTPHASHFGDDNLDADSTDHWRELSWRIVDGDG